MLRVCPPLHPFASQPHWSGFKKKKKKEGWFFRLLGRNGDCQAPDRKQEVLSSLFCYFVSFLMCWRIQFRARHMLCLWATASLSLWFPEEARLAGTAGPVDNRPVPPGQAHSFWKAHSLSVDLFQCFEVLFPSLFTYSFSICYVWSCWHELLLRGMFHIFSLYLILRNLIMLCIGAVFCLFLVIRVCPTLKFCGFTTFLSKI